VADRQRDQDADGLLQRPADRLTQGSVYALVALGYTLVYGILQLINFAHGDVFALSGLFASTVIARWFGLERRYDTSAIVVGLAATF
jgi:branched-chain amino acid transport system permease protein